VGANLFEMIALTVGGNTWIYYGTQAYKTFGVPICTVSFRGWTSSRTARIERVW
jgi:hypothetical protein